MLVFVSIVLPAAQGARSNPDVTPLPILSDWYFLGLYQMYKYLEPVVATEITMLIPLSVILLPFIDTYISGAEKDIMKRPVILLTSIMAFINWVAFSFLIIFNIANIHSDPPYWRGFLYCMVDVGILWQLWLMWTNPDAQQRARSATGAFILFVVGAIQTAVAVVYYYMAQTEMFLSPVGQAWIYGALRGFAGDNAEKVEKIVRHVMPINKEYWNFHLLLSPASLTKTPNPPGLDDFRRLMELSQQTTPIDGIFKLIPTFEPGDIHAQYSGLIDFMVNNRWCADFLVFSDRMTKGVIPPYPVGCPDLDMWSWMVAGPIVLIAALATWVYCSQSTQAKPAPAQAVPSGT
jgi:hypothetical protein